MDAQTNELLTRTDAGTQMGELIRRFWMPALLSEEIAEPDCPPVRVRLAGQDFVAFRDTQGRVGLLDPQCAHRCAELFFGRNEEGGLRCVYHGWKFDVNGACLEIPTEPADSKIKDKVRLRSYPVIERGGIVWAYLGPENQKPELPHIDFLKVPGSHVYSSKCLMRCNYMQALEGSMDTAHLSFLHSAPDMASVKSDALGVGDLLQFSEKDGVPRFFVSDTDYGLSIVARREAGKEHYYWRASQWLMPLAVLVASAPGSLLRGNLFIPIDDHNCWWYRVRWMRDRPLKTEEIKAFFTEGDYADLVPGTYEPKGNRGNDYLIDRAAQRTKSFTGIKTAQLQDIAVQESQGRIVDRSKEFLGTTDTGIARCRRALLTAAAALAKGVEPPATQRPAAYRVDAPARLLKREESFTVEALPRYEGESSIAA
jgi:phthalate 4,5-dioxygenase